MPPLSDTDRSLRAKGIGASEIAAVAGLNPYSSPWSVYLAKTVPGWEVEQTDAMELGHLLEEPLAQFYARRNPGVTLRPSSTLAHPEHAWALATPDREVLVDGAAVRLLEVKTAGLTTMREWGAEDDGIPEQYIAQVQWQMFVTGHSACDVCALVAGAPRFYRVERNSRLIEHLFRKGRAFMEMLAEGGTPPMDGSDAAKRWLQHRFPNERPPMREPSEGEVRLVQEYRATHEAIALATATKDRIANELRLRIGDDEGFKGSGAKATNKRPSGFLTNWKAVAEELCADAALIEKHSKPMERRLDVRMYEEKSR